MSNGVWVNLLNPQNANVEDKKAFKCIKYGLIKHEIWFTRSGK